MKIGIDAKRLFLNREGLGNYARTLIYYLSQYYPENDYHLFTTGIDKDIAGAWFLDEDKFTIHLPRLRLGRSLWRRFGITKVIKDTGLDIYLGLSNELPYGIQHTDCKSVVCIHDLFYLDFPEQFNNVDRWLTAGKTKHAIANADSVVAVSHHTKERILSNFEIEDGKVKVIYQSVDPAFKAVRQTAPGGKDQEYYLFVGSLVPRKNLEYVIRAYAQMEKSRRVPVKLVGKGRQEAYLRKLITENRLDAWFQFLGPKSSEELPSIYKKAKALLFPSLYEGFGRPVLEALECGIPVIHGNNSSLPEVAGDYGIVIDLQNTSSLIDAMEKTSHAPHTHLDRFDPQNIAMAWMAHLRDLCS